MCQWSTPSTESKSQHGDRIMFSAQCSVLYIHVLFHTLRHGDRGGKEEWPTVSSVAAEYSVCARVVSVL